MKKKKNKPHGYWSDEKNLLKELAKYNNDFTAFAKAEPSGVRIAYRDGLVERLNLKRRAYNKLDDQPKVRIRAFPKAFAQSR